MGSKCSKDKKNNNTSVETKNNLNENKNKNNSKDDKIKNDSNKNKIRKNSSKCTKGDKNNKDIKLITEKINKIIEKKSNDSKGTLSLEKKSEKNKAFDIDIFPKKDLQSKKQINFEKYKIIANNSNDNQFESSFITFTSINDILFLVFSTNANSIISYNLLNLEIINEIKRAHDNSITNFRHYCHKNNFGDLILSVSSGYNNMKLWRFKNWECLHEFKSINCIDFLFSACFLNDNGKLYILATNFRNYAISEKIKVFDLKGKLVTTINDSSESVFYIDTFYDKNLKTNYIVTANNNKIISYNFNKNKLYFKYEDSKDIYLYSSPISHYSFLIRNNNNLIEIIESGWDHYIKIWNFHTGELIYKIKFADQYLNGVDLLDNNILFVGCRLNKEIVVIDLETLENIKVLRGHSYIVITIKNFNHPKYGKCLISKGYGGEIIFWISKDKSIENN